MEEQHSPGRIRDKPADDEMPEKVPGNGNDTGGKKSYYYDDATGYQVYDPATDDEEDDDVTVGDG